MGKEATHLLHVSNISAFATRDQMLTLFSFFGRIEGYKIIMQATPSVVPMAVVQGVPTMLNLLPPVEDSEKASQEAYIRYKKDKYVNAARYLSDLLFLDKNIQCDAVPIGSLEEKGIQLDVLKRGEDVKYQLQKSPTPREHGRHHHYAGRDDRGYHYHRGRGGGSYGHYYERGYQPRGHYYERDHRRGEEGYHHHQRRSRDDYDEEEGRDKKRRRIHYP